MVREPVASARGLMAEISIEKFVTRFDKYLVIVSLLVGKLGEPNLNHHLA